MVLPTFVRQALAGQPITVFGDGTQSRSFTYVGDVVDALDQAGARAARHRRGVQHRQHRARCRFASWPSGSRRMTGSESPIQYVPYDEAYEAGFEDMPRRVPDISKIRALVGYEPKLGLDEIIRTRDRAHPAERRQSGRARYGRRLILSHWTATATRRHMQTFTRARASSRCSLGCAASRPRRRRSASSFRRRQGHACIAQNVPVESDPGRVGAPRRHHHRQRRARGRTAGHAGAHGRAGTGRRSTSCCAACSGYLVARARDGDQRRVDVRSHLIILPTSSRPRPRAASPHRPRRHRPSQVQRRSG